LRAPHADRWPLLQRMTDAMRPEDQADPAWAFWRARAVQARAKAGEAGDADRARAQAMLQALAGPQNFYSLLAMEELGARFSPAPAPARLTEAERDAAQRVPGFQRALLLISLGLRSEGVREWNFTLRDQNGDRALLAAAQLACEREVWDRCINTSDRTRAEIDLAQRYPTPFRQQVVAQSRAAGIDPALVYGLIRQESRFIMDARSGVGASGLMQLMPATARWTAKKVGLDYSPSMINDRDVNLRLGTSYLKLLIDDFEGAQALAAAGYNAGPGRPRRWREGPVLETAAWIENIPFNETRDYVKKVLANAVHYAAVLGEGSTSLKARLGATVGPRPPQAAEPNKDLP
jgi:soluble lytic murein transglycosylase